MRFGVIADRVAAIRDFFRQLGERADAPADKKKTGLRAMSIEQVQKPWRYRRIRPIVKSKRNRSWIVQPTDGRPEDL